MKFEPTYRWSPVDKINLIQLCKQQKVSIHCKLCDTVLMDNLGRRRTKETIWQFSINDYVSGHAHESCCYGVEMTNADAQDEDWGKSPHDWQ
jgi:hypothetical protein